MPFIDCKFSMKLTEEKKESVKKKLGECISIMHKPESYLMVGIDDGYSLYFAGEALEKGAYVSVSLFGKPAAGDCEKFTSALCALLKDELGIDGDCVYVTYHGVADWGWNGGNF